MSVIMQRALPDVRDGLKPGQRRVLYDMYEQHRHTINPTRKSATTVGSVLGGYHPHGDSSVYGTMVHLAQPFYMRYKLIDGKGNFGSIDGDPPAAYRYTESRMSGLADEMLRDIDKNVVPMVPNFDNRLKEPSVLPSRFPNLLVNGSMGIAVGMATNIPTHNLREVIDATVYRMDNPDCSIPELMNFIKSTDFPTYGTIHGVNGIKEAYLTGKGRIVVRGQAEVEEDKRRIVITEIPYGVNKSLLVESMAGLVRINASRGSARSGTSPPVRAVCASWWSTSARRTDTSSESALPLLPAAGYLRGQYAGTGQQRAEGAESGADLDHYIVHQGKRHTAAR